MISLRYCFTTALLLTTAFSSGPLVAAAHAKKRSAFNEWIITFVAENDHNQPIVPTSALACARRIAIAVYAIAAIKYQDLPPGEVTAEEFIDALRQIQAYEPDTSDPASNAFVRNRDAFLQSIRQGNDGSKGIAKRIVSALQLTSNFSINHLINIATDTTNLDTKRAVCWYTLAELVRYRDIHLGDKVSAELSAEDGKNLVISLALLTAASHLNHPNANKTDELYQTIIGPWQLETRKAAPFSLCFERDRAVQQFNAQQFKMDRTIKTLKTLFPTCNCNEPDAEDPRSLDDLLESIQGGARPQNTKNAPKKKSSHTQKNFRCTRQ